MSEFPSNQATEPKDSDDTAHAAAQLQSLLDEAPVLVAIHTGPEHIFVSCSRSYRDFTFGRAHPGKRLRDCLPELEEQGMIERFDRVYRKRERVHTPELAVGIQAAAVRDVRYLDQILQPWFDRNGRVGGVLSFALDISDRVRGRRALEERERAVEARERRLQAILEHAGVGIGTLDDQGRWIDANPTLCEMLGYTSAELRGLALRDITHPDDRRDGDVQMQRVLSGERDAYAAELRCLRKDGSEVWVHLRATLADPFARRKELIAIVEDGTAGRRQRREMEDAARLKDEFIAMLGHELRNPLAALSNAAQLQKELPLDDPHFLRSRAIIERQVAHMRRLVDDLLDVARIVRQKIHLVKEIVNLAEPVRAVVSDQENRATARQLSLEVSVQDEPLWVHGDRARLYQIVDNLVGNGIKFTPACGKIRVEVLREGGDAIIRVHDSGMGFVHDELPQMFQAFHQNEHNMQRGSAGLGLGLALVKGLVDLHEGRVQASSEGRGLGATFEVRLPLRPSPFVPAEPRQVRSGSRPRKVLVVEDDHDTASLLGDLLRRAGHEVRIVHDAEGALRLAAELHPEAVVCDIGLPGGKDGYAVARSIRADPQLRTARLVALTGYGRDRDRARAKEAGFDEHLTKPVDLDALQAAIGGLSHTPDV